MTNERKTKVTKVAMKVLGTTLEAVGMAIVACTAAVIGGKIALNEFTKDGVNVTVNKVEDAVTFEEVE